MITGKILKSRGWSEGRVIGLAKRAAAILAESGLSRAQILDRLDEVRAAPDKFTAEEPFSPLAAEILRREVKEISKIADELRENPLPFGIWGAGGIDAGAVTQMENSLRLPISVAGALMPDAHIGYGLPIGGVLATQDAVIPYAVGVDIACFAGETRVPLLDGRDYPICELAERKEKFGVYACRADGRVFAAWATAFQTRDRAALLRVTLDNGESVRCTPNHLFMLRDGSFREAGKLAPGDSLMPFYSQKDREGYTRIQQNYSGFFQRSHWLVARSGLLGPVPKFEGQRTIIHHKNFDESDNRPENLEWMGDQDHSRLHRCLVERNQHWQSPEFERLRVAALAAKAQTPEGHEFYAQRGGQNLRAYWENDYERAKANYAGNGERGKVYLVAKNQSEAGRAKSRELANRIYVCETSGAAVRSPIGLHNHRRSRHGYNHKVVSVATLTEKEEVFCLSVPSLENFALSAGIFVHNCRMRLSIYEASPHVLGQHKARFEKSLRERTRFGLKERWERGDLADHAVLEDEDWRATPLLKSLRPKAIEQLGTSGSGNHFVEWGEFELEAAAPEFGLEAGKYLALLSHSGSRGVGFKIANTFSRLAMDFHPQLPPSVRQLAWLDLDSEAGQEYWLAMELAGKFASANHFVIHRRVAEAAGFKEVAHVENHHNFAWNEKLENGDDVIVHRKGATPAGKGVLGVIPGSMGDPGFVVRGKGLGSSLHSASHGAGRKMGRKQAKNSLTKLERDRYLQKSGVTLLGGGLDEAPQAYKDIHAVLAAQADLVEVVGKFTPRIVRMADEAGEF